MRILTTSDLEGVSGGWSFGSFVVGVVEGMVVDTVVGWASTVNNNLDMGYIDNGYMCISADSPSLGDCDSGGSCSAGDSGW